MRPGQWRGRGSLRLHLQREAPLLLADAGVLGRFFHPRYLQKFEGGFSDIPARPLHFTPETSKAPGRRPVAGWRQNREAPGSCPSSGREPSARFASRGGGALSPLGREVTAGHPDVSFVPLPLALELLPGRGGHSASRTLLHLQRRGREKQIHSLVPKEKGRTYRENRFRGYTLQSKIPKPITTDKDEQCATNI